MKKTLFLFVGLLCFVVFHARAQYNTLWIPDTLSGTEFKISIKDTFKQFLPGQQTITGGINGNFWGPTLIFRQGDSVHLHVTNKMQDSTTLHWHGMHLPPEMDGGPHQILPPGITWTPSWKVTNHAALYWYHPHLHMETEAQINSGVGGLIIVRDAQEAALNLPRHYGVDDIPLVLTDRAFDNSNQFKLRHYGDTMMCNGTLHAQYGVPAQFVRFRLLNAATERYYNLGFSDNRDFYIITTDGGLVDAPVKVNRFLIAPGERVEILVDFSADENKSVDLKAYNSTLSNDLPGFEPTNFQATDFQNALGKRDFAIVHFNVNAATRYAVTAIPQSLVKNTFWSASQAMVTRHLVLSNAQGPSFPPGSALIDNTLFDINKINKTVGLNNIEIWELENRSNIAHPFHIHDVEFYILDRNGAAAPNYEQGWKDVVYVRANTTVKFIARFEDYADTTHPFMYHCHIAFHEDNGMMGQFVVSKAASGIAEVSPVNTGISLYPNPATHYLTVDGADDLQEATSVIINQLGQRIMTTTISGPRSQLDISALTPGFYILNVYNKNGSVYTKSFIRQ